jgi:hypothetical protein
MGKIIVLNNTDVSNYNIDNTNNFVVNFPDKKTTSGWSFLNFITRAKKKFVSNFHIFDPQGKYGLTLLATFFRFLFIVVEEVVLLVFLSVYFIIGATAVILYVVFYEKIYEKLVLKFKKKDKSSSVSEYRWISPSLNLDCKKL